MFQRIFGRSRRGEGEESQEAEAPPPRLEDDFVVLGLDRPAPPSAASQYSLSGATAFGRDSDALSPDDPTQGVPVKLTVDACEAPTSSAVREALTVVERVQTFDWDAFEYNFDLEKSVLEEFRVKLQSSCNGGLEDEKLGWAK